MEALLATQGWQKLELETKFLDELMEAAEQLWVKDQYWSARPYYVEVLDCIKRDQRLSDSQYTDDFIRVRLGACYANEGNDRAAIEQFEEALKLSKDNVRQVSAGSDKFKKAIGPIKDAPSFKQFCEKLQS
jgi:tetratricopeptide (TPR) repeat protein